jgi:hypothetical protein
LEQEVGGSVPILHEGMRQIVPGHLILNHLEFGEAIALERP